MYIWHLRKVWPQEQSRASHSKTDEGIAKHKWIKARGVRRELAGPVCINGIGPLLEKRGR